MTYKGLEYEDDVIIFDNQEEALSYDGDKKFCLIVI